MMITSACRGVALATSNPKREKSYFAEATAIISIPQQLVANVSGHKELERAQLINSSNLLSTMPPPGRSCVSPGNEGEIGVVEDSFCLLFSIFIRNIVN